jgi:hypothetical protein
MRNEKFSLLDDGWLNVLGDYDYDDVGTSSRRLFTCLHLLLNFKKTDSLKE